jgi:hypothetical protein
VSHTIKNAFNEYFLSMVKKKCVDDGDGNDANGNMDNNNTYMPTYYLLNAFKNLFPKSTTQEIENIIKSLKRKNTYRYDEVPTNLLKISLIYINSPLIIYVLNIRDFSSTLINNL